MPNLSNKEGGQRIKGKITIINLWASWCSPYYRKGIELIPVYEEYKDRRFEIVGVARERDKEADIRAAQMDRYP
ncbi:MAG: TlpA family protein disulfide reductase [Parapedobacter sp.]|nr:MAG: TlpA family protein disulfide reductase [Parapedobacter sp.]